VSARDGGSAGDAVNVEVRFTRAELEAILPPLPEMDARSGYTGQQMVEYALTALLPAAIKHAQSSPTSLTPIGWMTRESRARLTSFGNGSRGSVPLHSKRSNVACLPVFAACEAQP
jgi:hypothetical protein